MLLISVWVSYKDCCYCHQGSNTPPILRTLLAAWLTTFSPAPPLSACTCRECEVVHLKTPLRQDWPPGLQPGMAPCWPFGPHYLPAAWLITALLSTSSLLAQILERCTLKGKTNSGTIASLAHSPDNAIRASESSCLASCMTERGLPVTLAPACTECGAIHVKRSLQHHRLPGCQPRQRHAGLLVLMLCQLHG